IVEMEPDIENMTLNEYLEYKAEKERRLKRDVRSKRSPTKYKEADFGYQCYTEDGLMFSNNSDEEDIDSMTIAEYELYIAKQGLKKDPLNDHSYNFTSNSYSQSPYTPNPQPKDKELSFEEDYNNWEITVEDVERLRQILTPTVHILHEPDHVGQPLVPLIPSPDEVKVVREEEPANDVFSISIQVLDVIDDLSKEFRDEILDITVVDEEVDFNPTRDIEELERLIATDHESSFTKIKVLSCIVKTNVEHETFVRQMNLLYRLSQSAKSSTKTRKKLREMTSAPRILDSTLGLRRSWSAYFKDIIIPHNYGVVPPLDYAVVLWVCSLETLTRFHSSTRAIEWFKRLVAYAKWNRDSYETTQVDALVGELDVARGSRLGAVLEECYLSIRPPYRANLGEFLIYMLKFDSSGEKGLEIDTHLTILAFIF
ncbi:hypothetical protein Tco_1256955, partial [Tanacetum coccineum]